MDPRRHLAVPALAVMVLAACSDSREADETLPPIEPTVSTAATPPTSAAPATTTAAPGTSATATTATATTSAPTTSAPTTAAPTTATPTAPPTTGAPAPTGAPTPTTTANPGGGSGLVLGTDGVGSAQFGDDPDAVIANVQAALGPPSEDSGWVDPFTISACPGSEYRRVSWGALSLQFSDSTRFASDRRHFFGFEYGLVGQINAEPAGLTTDKGVGVGTTVADLKAAYPRATIGAGEEGLSSPYFAVPGVFQGELTGVSDDDVVMLIFGGEICGG